MMPTFSSPQCSVNACADLSLSSTASSGPSSYLTEDFALTLNLTKDSCMTVTLLTTWAVLWPYRSLYGKSCHTTFGATITALSTMSCHKIGQLNLKSLFKCSTLHYQPDLTKKTFKKHSPALKSSTFCLGYQGSLRLPKFEWQMLLEDVQMHEYSCDEILIPGIISQAFNLHNGFQTQCMNLTTSQVSEGFKDLKV